MTEEQERILRLKPPKMWVSGFIAYLDDDGPIDKVMFFPEDLELAPPKDWEHLLLVKTLSKEDKRILDDFFVRMYFSEEKKVK